jgi:hypothetical protein
VVWAAFVVMVAYFQEDVMRALILGLVQEAFLLGVALLIWYLLHRRNSSGWRQPGTLNTHAIVSAVMPARRPVVAGVYREIDQKISRIEVAARESTRPIPFAESEYSGSRANFPIPW